MKKFKKLSREDQRNIKGGKVFFPDCPSGCYAQFATGEIPGTCVVTALDRPGCIGTIQEGLCCI
ncbi:MAG TPA: hypothetical protein DCS93_40955 [Microscillaceae bacterium]|nr:hypothetical protein [Microscillaceae bacterium]